MDIVLILVRSFVLCSSIYAFISTLTCRRFSRLPPGPYAFPVIGNIFHLGQNPHQSIARLAKLYGPIMSLKLGSITTIVVSSPSIAKEILQKHDHNFSSRTIPTAACVFDHYKASMLWLPVSNKWRNLRKISKELMFSVQVLDTSQGLRLQKLHELCDYLRSCSIRGQVVDIGEVLFVTVLNLISTTLFSMDLAKYGTSSSQEFEKIAYGLMDAVAPNVADYFPVLKLIGIDPQGISSQTLFYTEKMLGFFEGIIHERLQSRCSSVNSSRKTDILDSLLDYSMKNASEFSSNDLRHLLIDLFIAGLDSTSTTMEWVITLLLKNPQKLAKARAELDQVLGKKQTVEESDIPKLPYLRAVLKETFRFQPIGPLLVPHKANADVEINGYIVPKGAQLIFNIGSICKDSSIWPEAEMFVPERFLGSEIDLKGGHFELFPFGSGRRICPGLPLAYRMMHLTIAILIQKFDWKLEEGMKLEDIDMHERFGLAVHKAVPLKAIPVQL